ncbi:hypothetical protein CRI77_20935 [Mycolicibacterium duvalii]|uniref:Uncharacterized protein n=1 Tax=Mycolicibacterium duvalii TaxID=39688 RepID=A0A7I7K0I4_9MYCO|nr:hypothetical protein [Mycolicibacterium duvalii]MCV7370507.1 hypothetical protein [Mycolicibacterium duvalii]PEG37427.1 hypothetical protein CRI77_20935 [Mycolicibacterium duvalii]BBX17670.1 hypothetical protein MDUV_25300 [Mycolicibacterium duvalii]
MTISLTDSMTEDFVLPSRHAWWDEDAQCTLIMSQPSLDRELWLRYLEGAERSYQKFGVGRAIDVADISDGHDTALFWAALDSSGRVIGGVRAKGPLTGADDSHAVVEWDGQPGLPAVRKMIDDRVPFGVLEMKAAFVDDRPGNPQGVIRALARSGSHAMAVMDVQFCMATSAPHVLDKWRTSGGVVAAIPATPYPDPRYRTKMMWWDRRTWIRHAEPSQISRIFADLRDLERAGVTYGSASALRDNAL